MKRKRNFKVFAIILGSCIFLIFSHSVFAEDEKMPIIVDGDHVEFFNEEKKVVASGNVSIEYKETKLLADKVVVYSQTKDCEAEGHVRLIYENGSLEGDKILYNFQDKMGSIINADIATSPYYARSPLTKKLSDKELVLRRGYFSTCDLDRPHWKILAKRVYIYPEDRVVAKNASFFIGNWPILTLPQYVHLLNDRRPRVRVVPGKDKDWGYYLLTAWRYYINDQVKGRLHLDYRERKDFAHGIDLNYRPKGFGEGSLRTYYMHERAIVPDHLYDTPRDTEERERFRVEWRHKWQITPSTNILWQYHKLKDADFLKDYFDREYEIVASPNTYMQLTHAQYMYSLNLLLEKRINRFTSTLEKLPEISLETIDFKLGDSRFYFKSDNLFSIHI